MRKVETLYQSRVTALLPSASRLRGSVFCLSCDPEQKERPFQYLIVLCNGHSYSKVVIQVLQMFYVKLMLKMGRVMT